MSIINILLIVFITILATGRNILSKEISGLKFGTKSFYLSQFVSFLSGSVVALAFGLKFLEVAPIPCYTQ